MTFRALALFLALAATAAAKPVKRPAMRTLSFATDVAKAITKETAPTPAELRFSLEGPPKVTADAVVLTGVLENPTAKDVPAVVFPVVNWASPFYLELRTDDAVHWKPPGPDEPPLPPPAPPPPMRIVIPAHSRVVFDTSVELRRYAWTGTPEAAFTWKFLFWNEPQPSGTFRIRLPER